VYRRCPILIVEDSDEDFYATARVLGKFVASPVERCSTGTDVLPHLARKTAQKATKVTPDPCLILLDLNLPGKRDGRSVLVDLKSDKRYRRIPVVIMTTSSNPTDVHQCFDRGAAGYIVKPVNLDKFVDSIECMVNYWFKTVKLPVQLEEDGV
jgi:CheY-like chemotaxis protein